MAKFCTNCGAAITDSTRFCTACGHAQSAAQTQQAQTQVQQAQIQPPAPAYASAAARRRGRTSTIGGIVILGAVALAVALIVNIVGGLLGSTRGGNSAATGSSGITTYEIFGDGKLIKEPQRLTARASAEDGISAAALVGPWEGSQRRVTTAYGFTDDGYFYKNVTIDNSYTRSIYHPGYTSYGYYTTYYSGYWTYEYVPSFTYLDTLIGEYRVRGGVIEFDHVVAITRTAFEDDWYNKNTRSVSMETLRSGAKSSRMQDDFSEEFEFINPTRIRFRDENSDLDLFWEMKDDPHNVKIPGHEIPAVDWPKKALSPDMPELKTKGRVREASLSYSGDDANIKPEFKTVTVVIDKVSALSELDAYGSSLKQSGWWMEDYELGSEDTSLSYEARKGMFKLAVSNGNGSGTSADTIVLESTRYPEGQWPKTWSKAGLLSPDKSVAVGEIKAEQNDEKDIYETIIFDKVDESGVKAYMDQLVGDGFKIPQNSYNDWELMKYIRIDKDLYLAEITLDQRMDSLTSFTYDLTYVPDGIWPESWKNGGLPVPDGIETIAGAIDAEGWAESLTDYGSDYKSIKFLGLDAGEMNAYLSKLKTTGFTQVQDEYSDDVKLYAYLRIDGKMLRIEVAPQENEDIAEISYSFKYYEDGKWPDIWRDSGLPAPEGMDTILGAIDLEQWAQSIADYDSDYLMIKFLELSAKETEQYLVKLKSLGFREVEDSWSDSVQLYNYMRIDGMLCRVEIEQAENDELTEFSYSFRYFEDGQWPSQWASAGIPAPACTAMLGKLDMAEFNESLSWGSYSVSIKLLGANLSDYAALLKRNGFTEPEYSYSDTWELVKHVGLDGKQVTVTIEDANNQEIPEIGIYIREDS